VLGTVGLGIAEELGTEEGGIGGAETDEEDDLVREVGGMVSVIVVEVVVVKLRVTGMAPLNGKIDVLEADELGDIDELGDTASAWLLLEEAV